MKKKLQAGLVAVRADESHVETLLLVLVRRMAVDKEFDSDASLILSLARSGWHR